MTLKPTSSQGSGGSGTVTSVSSANTSIAVATGTTTPVLTVAPLNTIATNAGATLAVSHLAAGTAGQVLGGTGPSYALPPGYEFDYAALTTNLTVTATTAVTAQTVCAGNAVTYDGSTRVKIEFGANDVSTGTAGNIVFELWDGSTDLGLLAYSSTVPTNAERSLYAATFLTPSNASHTYSVLVWKSSATGSFVVNAGTAFSGSNPTADPPTWYRITKA